MGRASLSSQGFDRGFLTSIDGFAPSIEYHPNGMVHQVKHANGVDWLQRPDPHDMGRPSRIRTSGASEGLDTGVFGYDGAGDITRIGADRYVYDLLSRVEEAQLGEYPESCGGDLTLTATTETEPVTHEACGTIDAGPSYTVASAVTLRAEGRVALHDGFAVASGGALAVESGTPVNPGPTGPVDRDFVWRGSTALASIRDIGPHLPETTHHLHPDHLGTPRLITDGQGNTLAERVYFPFGQEATPPSTAEVLKFTGHERDYFADQAGGTTDDLDYMHARYYSPHLGRFLSFDSIGGNGANPQSWNRYAYTLGNPLKYTDPSGLIAQLFHDLCFLQGACSNEFVDVVGEDPGRGFNPLTGVQGLGDLVSGGGFMLELSGAINGGLSRSFEVSFGERVQSSIPSGLAQFTGDAIVGFGDTLSFGLTEVYRTEVGLAHTVNKGSAAYLTGQVAGVAHGVVLGAAGTFRASASTRIFGKNTFLNTGRRFRIGHSGHEGKTFFSIRGELVDRLKGQPKAHIDLWRINRPR